MTTIFFGLLALLMLGVLITVHEAGHFFAARLCGIEVVEFAIGMGPKLWSRKGKKGTIFSLRAVPFGGFCQFYGEDEEAKDERSFANYPVWKRLITVSAGVVMNFVLAFVIVFLFFAFSGQQAMLPVVGELVPGGAAEAAGFLPGDRILSVEGQATANSGDAVNLISPRAGQETAIRVDRDGTEVALTVTPLLNEQEGRGMIGIQFDESTTYTFHLNPWQAAVQSVRFNARSAVLLVEALGGMVFRGEGLDQVTGPLGTIDIIQQETRTGGFAAYLSLMAFISVNLGVMNLLPIPGLDGSRLVFLLIEGIRRKPVNPRIEGMVHAAGFMLLVGLMLLVTYQDILRFFSA